MILEGRTLIHKDFPIMLSRRVGLRTITSITGIKRLICPKGEQITNGGFETGDDTGWIGRYYSISTLFPRSGRYSMIIHSSDGGAWQELAKPFPRKCVRNFGFWFTKIEDFGWSGIYAVVNDFICDGMEAVYGEWRYYNIAEMLPLDFPDIERIAFWTFRRWPYPYEAVSVDDVTLTA